MVYIIENLGFVFYTKTMSEQKGKKTKKKTSGLNLALWVVAALILLVIFLVNQNRIARNLKSTGFFSKTGIKTPVFVEQADETSDKKQNKNDVAPIETIEIDLNGIGSHIEEEKQEVVPAVVAQNELSKQQQEEIVEKKQIVEEQKKQTVEKKEVSIKKEISVKTEQPVSMMKLKLYFMTINSDGSVLRKEVTREMKKTDSPLMDSIKALISGPTAAEERNGCRSLISDETKLIGASVKNGTAVLNFSGEFEFNQYGIEGLRGQLQQIVWTATAFPTVENVQFLIDGEKREYLGSEGVWIGTPLNRNSF